MKIKTPFFILEIEILFIIIILLTMFSTTFRNYLSNYFICYFFIIFHELSHMFVAAIFGKEIEIFKFSSSGVNIQFSKNKNNKINKLIEIIIYVAGPISNILLALIFNKYDMIFQINIILAIINLFPIFPLDGYNILKNIISNFYNIKKTNFILKIINNILCVILFVIGLVQVINFKIPSILVFLTYIFLLNQNNKKYMKFQEIQYITLC